MYAAGLLGPNLDNLSHTTASQYRTSETTPIASPLKEGGRCHLKCENISLHLPFHEFVGSIPRAHFVTFLVH